MQPVAERIVATLERFLHVEAASGIALLTAAAVALLWANSPIAASYHALWHTPLSIGFGDFIAAQSLEFLINEGLMTIFFLLVGLEIRREIYEGTQATRRSATLRSATLPLAAAAGGVAVPAAIYLLLSDDAAKRVGWAVPTATDIALAVGLLHCHARIPGAFPTRRGKARRSRRIGDRRRCRPFARTASSAHAGYERSRFAREERRVAVGDHRS